MGFQSPPITNFYPQIDGFGKPSYELQNTF
jgi:hypothetical protein